MSDISKTSFPYITSITITSLFGIEGNDYKIDLQKDSLFTILYAFNGVGKTTILKLIEAVLNQMFIVLDKILFSKVQISFVDKTELTLFKPLIKSFKDVNIKDLDMLRREYNASSLIFPLFYEFRDLKDNKLLHSLYLTLTENYISSKSVNEIIERQPNLNFFQMISQVGLEISSITWFLYNEKPVFDLDRNLSKGKFLESPLFLSKSYKAFLIAANKSLNRNSNELDDLISTCGALLKEHSEVLDLFKNYEDDNLDKRISYRISLLENKIIEYFKKICSTDSQEFISLQKDLNKITDKTEYRNKLFSKMDLIQDTYYLYEKASMLNDLDKTKTVSGIKEKEYKKEIEYFLGLLNDKFELVNKTIEYDRNSSKFYYRYLDYDILDNKCLSSGEAKLFNIIYEFVFSTGNKNDKDPSHFILIDEPESSLHICWQEQLIQRLVETSFDLDKDVQILISTHSPNIVSYYEDFASPIQKIGKIKR